MRLGFDLRPFLRQETGVGMYLKNLLFQLASLDRTNEYFLFSASWKDRFPAEKIPPFARLRFRDLPLPVRALNFFWRRVGWPTLDRVFGTRLDLTHSATPLPLPTRGRKIITVHDLFFMDFPERSGKEAGQVFFRRTAQSIHRADGIITFSGFTRTELASRFGADERRVRVIPHGLDKRFLEPVGASELKATRKSRRLPPSFLLFVGAQEPRKNLLRLLDALKIVHLRGIRIPLVLVGPPGEDSEPIRARSEALGLGHWVIMTGYLPEKDVRHIYRLASAFVFPSLCEGFGLPLVEAMASGAPVVASLTSAVPEVCQDGAVYFRPEDPDEMAARIVSVLEDGELKEQLIDKGRKRALNFSWEKAAAETLAFYRTLAQSP
ncbi:MAG: glycosyltransferase family 1 protein [Acidobacteriota bacterium]